MQTRGTEQVDGGGTAEQERKEYRRGLDESVEYVNTSDQRAVHDRIKAQAPEVYRARQDEPSEIVKPSRSLKRRNAAKKRNLAGRNDKKRIGKKA